MPFDEQIDWSRCPLVEMKPQVQSGAPVLRGTRIPVSAIIDNFVHGLNAAEIAEQFQVPLDQAQAILKYARAQGFFRFVKAVKIGEEQLERGDSLSHDEVGERIKRLRNPH